MKFKLVIAISLLISSCAFALTGEEIIERVDDNMTYKSAYFESTMKIKVRDQIREKKMIVYAEGKDKSFAEFISPARDKGVKYLKIDDNMWMYLPSVEKIIKIAGHMLRQSMMGSDFSYEDALESGKLLEKYYVKVTGEEIIDKRPCYVLELTAKVKDVTYYKRKLWVDKDYFLPTREELFAKSGKKLKVMELGDFQKFGSRYYPMQIILKNLLRKNSLTEMTTTKARFNIKLPAGIFTQRNLRQ